MKNKFSPKMVVVITVAIGLLALLAYMRFWPDPKVVEAVGPQGLVFGQPRAPVTVVAFLSPGCSHCKEFENESATVLYQAAAAGKLRYVIYPVKTGSATNQDMAALLCAAHQGAFPTFLKLRFSNTEGLRELARQAGLNPRSFNRCLESDQTRSKATQIASWAQHLDVQATPTFFVQEVHEAPFRKIVGNKGVDYWLKLSKL